MLSKVAVTACAVAFGFAVKDQLIRLVPVPLKREKPPVTSQSYSTTSVYLGNDKSSSDVSQENPNVPIKRKVTLPVTSDRIKRRIKQTRELAKLLQSENTNLSVSEKVELKTGLKNLEKLVNQKPGTHVPAERFQDSLYHVDSFTSDSFDTSQSEEEEHRLAQLENLLVLLLRLLSTSVSENRRQFDLVWVNDLVTLLSRFINNNVGHQSEISEAMLQVSIGKILCSLTSEDQYRKIILKNQVITQTLSTWKDSNVSYLKLLGRKILWNLSNPKEWLPDGIYIWTGENQSLRSSHCGDIVFVHGLGGSAFYTWREGGNRNQKFKTCWPMSWLMHDLNSKCRLIFLDYNSIRPQAPQSSTNQNPSLLTNENQGRSNAATDMSRFSDKDSETSIELHADDFLDKLQKVPKFGQRPILFICHSMGGLIVKQLLVKADEKQQKTLRPSIASNLITQTQGILFLSTPHLGSSIASKFSSLPSTWLTVSPTLSELSNVPKLFKLNYDFAKVMLKTRADCVNVAESLPTKFGFGISFVIVPVLSAYPGFGKMRIIKKDHMNVSKPSSKEDLVYELITEFIYEKPCFQSLSDVEQEEEESEARNKLLDLINMDLI